MRRLGTLICIVFAGLGVKQTAGQEVWPLDSTRSTAFRVVGNLSTTGGVVDQSVVFAGNSVIKVKESAKLAAGDTGFTLLAWVNPHLLNAEQQMIAAKNRYSLGERQWSVMIDSDNQFRLYAHQGKWVTADCPERVRPGHWYLVGVVFRQGKAELWVNGKLAGDVPLKEAIAQTNAPLTFGGVDDNGRLRQGLVGALDDIRLFDKPLSPKQMASAFTPVESTHKVPKPKPPLKLWTGDLPPTTLQAERLEGLSFNVIKRHEPEVDGYRFLHGVAVVWHKGKLYASFGHNKGSENTLTEEGRYCVSDDGGRTWTTVKTIDTGDDQDDLAVSHGVFLSFRDKLWAFLGSFYGTRKRVHTRAYTLDEATGQWTAEGTVIKEGFWPMNQPVKMEDGNWIMPGFIVEQNYPAAVAISHGDDLKSWTVKVISCNADVGRMWGESAILVDGERVTNIARYGAKPLALVSTSSDYGRTWSPSTVSNLPMAASKPCSGILSNGQRYLIGSSTADGGNRRSPLTIAVSKPGQNEFLKLFVIRDAVFEDGPGESDSGAALSYPYATEYRGKLYVGYSNNGSRRGNDNSAELAVIPLGKLEVE